MQDNYSYIKNCTILTFFKNKSKNNRQIHSSARQSSAFYDCKIAVWRKLCVRDNERFTGTARAVRKLALKYAGHDAV